MRNDGQKMAFETQKCVSDFSRTGHVKNIPRSRLRKNFPRRNVRIFSRAKKRKQFSEKEDNLPEGIDPTEKCLRAL